MAQTVTCSAYVPKSTNAAVQQLASGTTILQLHPSTILKHLWAHRYSSRNIAHHRKQKKHRKKRSLHTKILRKFQNSYLILILYPTTHTMKNKKETRETKSIKQKTEEPRAYTPAVSTRTQKEHFDSARLPVSLGFNSTKQPATTAQQQQQQKNRITIHHHRGHTHIALLPGYITRNYRQHTHRPYVCMYDTRTTRVELCYG